MEKLEENGYAYLQSAIDHSLKKIFMIKSQTSSAIPPRNGRGLIILQVWNISCFP